MDIKIIKKYKFTGGDAVSHYDAHFETNPTMEEFFEWIIKENPEDWGVVENPELWPDNYMEYSDGEIVRVCDNYNEIKDKTISLCSMDGGWTKMDYTIEIVD